MNSKGQDTVWQEYHQFTQAFNYARSHNDNQYAMFRDGHIRFPRFIDVEEAQRRIKGGEWELAPMDVDKLREALGDPTV